MEYTLLRCAAPACTGPHVPNDPTGTAATDLAVRTLAVVRERVRSSRGGVLVSTGCTLGPVTCRARPPGPLLLVQPCDRERNPTRPALRIGPLRTLADLDAVDAWLGEGHLDPDLLPRRLTALCPATTTGPRAN